MYRSPRASEKFSVEKFIVGVTGKEAGKMGRNGFEEVPTY